MATILVADDSETILLLMRTRLEMAGHAVETAAGLDEPRRGGVDVAHGDVRGDGRSLGGRGARGRDGLGAKGQVGLHEVGACHPAPPLREERADRRDEVVVLSHSLWQGAFGGEAGVLGRKVVVDGRPRVVVGVMPPGVEHRGGADVGRAVAAELDGLDGDRMAGNLCYDLIILDLMLPTISGVEVIKQIRAEETFAKTPVIVFSNTYLTNLIQDAWRAGASKCLSKTNCSPKDFIDVVRNTIGPSAEVVRPPTSAVAAPQAGNTASMNLENDAEFQAGLRRTFIESLPATLAALRSGLMGLVKADNEMARLKQIYELYRRVHALNGNAGLAGLAQIAHMASACEALLKELYEKPKNINASTTRTVAAAVDFLGILFDRTALLEQQQPLISKILVVDDEPQIVRVLRAALQSNGYEIFTAANGAEAPEVFLDVNPALGITNLVMPEMDGVELTREIRQRTSTPVIVVSVKSEEREQIRALDEGADDYITKPFAIQELLASVRVQLRRAAEREAESD